MQPRGTGYSTKKVLPTFYGSFEYPRAPECKISKSNSKGGVKYSREQIPVVHSTATHIRITIALVAETSFVTRATTTLLPSLLSVAMDCGHPSYSARWPPDVTQRGGQHRSFLIHRYFQHSTYFLRYLVSYFSARRVPVAPSFPWSTGESKLM